MRWKIIVPNLLVVLACGLAGWLSLSGYYTTYFDEQAEETLERDRNLFVKVNQLGAVEFLRTVMGRSRASEVSDIFAPSTEQERLRATGRPAAAPAPDGEGQEASAPAEPSAHEELLVRSNRAHRECQAFRAVLAGEQSIGRTPEIVAVTDQTGAVISRDVDPNAEPVGQNFGERYPSVRRALEGHAVRDFWYWHGFLLDVAIAPIYRQGEVVGAMFVGYDVSNGVAQANGRMFGVDVVYLVHQQEQWRLHSSSIAVGERRHSLVAGIGSQQEALVQSMESTEEANYLSFDVSGDGHIGLAGVLAGSDSSVRAGYILLNSVTAVRAPAARLILVFFIGLGGALLVAIIGFLLGSHFLKPVEEIEEGVLRVINGDITHRFEVNSSEFGGLAYRVNQLVAVLTGEEEESEEEGGAGGA
jgi:HAMP domain-containing protein